MKNIVIIITVTKLKINITIVVTPILNHYIITLYFETRLFTYVALSSERSSLSINNMVMNNSYYQYL